MTPTDLLASFLTRGIRVRLGADRRLRLNPSSLVTPEELEFIKANSAAVVALLSDPPPSAKPDDTMTIDMEIDSALLREQAAEAAREEQASKPRGRAGYTMFRLAGEPHALFLHQLTASHVQRLRAAGKITDDEVREWLDRQNKPRGGSLF
jgi:hypothetical protein